MRRESHITVIIPALNEEQSIGRVLDAIPDWVDRIIVADNGSSDETPDIARANGADVVVAGRRGYGSACLEGIASIDSTDIVVFLDGDFSDHPEQMNSLVDPIIDGCADMVIGSRVLGNDEPGALTPQARFGNMLACLLIRLFWKVRYTDLGPFRAIRYRTLQSLGMEDPDYGWTVEMQIKAVLNGASVREVPVDYRKRVGLSKVSGTVRGIVGAGYKILSTIFISASKYYLLRPNSDGRQGLVIFTRFPLPGETKTRLIPALGEEGAARLQREMTEHVVSSTSDMANAALEIRYTGASAGDMRDWLGDGFNYVPQGEGDLGARMMRAFRDAFHTGMDRVVIVGTDCPDITAGIIDAAFDALTNADIVLGPATDGGYYLIGLRRRTASRALPGTFQSISWGTASVLDETRRVIRERGLKAIELAPLDDVDRPEDVAAWERVQEALSGSSRRPDMTIIIPVLDESERIRSALDCILKVEGVEALLVDGGSTDDTVAIARASGATVIETERGRAHQMNVGAARAQGDILVFLHADTKLPEGFENGVRAVLSEPGVSAGAFRFSTDDDSPSMRFIGWWANMRSEWLRMPYGDQALFMRKHTFREVGGYPDIPIMEDFALVVKLSRRGRVRTAEDHAVTSSRRWRKIGNWRTVLYNQIVVLLYILGVSPEWIARFYDRARGVT